MTALEVFKKLEGMVEVSYYLTPSEYKTLTDKIEAFEPDPKLDPAATKPVVKATKKVIKKDC